MPDRRRFDSLRQAIRGFALASEWRCRRLRGEPSVPGRHIDRMSRAAEYLYRRVRRQEQQEARA